MNKNTKAVRLAISKASKMKEAFAVCWNKKWPAAISGARGIVSVSPARNMCMRVLHNQNSVGQTASLTVHEPLEKNMPVVFKRHNYIAKAELYKQPILRS